MQDSETSRTTPRRHATLPCFLLILLAPQLGWAVGTPAGTVISNTATVSYSLDGSGMVPVTSAPALLTVDELIKPTVTWQDAAPVSVNTPGANDALAFWLTNSGNGQEAFSLTRNNGLTPLPAGNYTPLNGSVGSIYFESGLQAGFQAAGPNADTAYISGTNDPSLAPDATQIVYVISDTPSVAGNAHGDVLLTATSLTAGAAGATVPGASTAGLVGCTANCAAVFATAYGQASATGSYVANGLGLVVDKTVAGVLDPGGSAVLMPAAVLTYRIAVTLSGTGTASNVTITDPLPADVTYVAGSITVDSIVMTDASDSDIAEFAANTVSVSLGNVAAPANFVITFRATIN